MKDTPADAQGPLSTPQGPAGSGIPGSNTAEPGTTGKGHTGTGTAGHLATGHGADASGTGRHIVVVGAGFGGLETVIGLKGAGCTITLIDQRNHHLFQPLLYQVATTVLATSAIAWPVRGIFRRRADVTTLLAQVRGVDVEARRVRLDDGSTVPYDMLVLATGARHAYFGNEQWEKVAPGLKTLEDATLIRRRILLAFEQAERAEDPEVRRALMTFGVIGGGPTGVELAGMIAELAHRSLRRDFRRIDTARARVVLIEAGPRLLPAFPEPLSDYTRRALERRGVEVMLGRPVADVTEEGLRLGAEFLPCRTALWGAGVAASPAADWVGVAGDRVGRVPVTAELTVPSRPEIFVIGDTAAVKQGDDSLVPGIAPAAKQQGAHVARVIRARVQGTPEPGPFRYRHLGNLATIGRAAAVVDMGRVRLTGALAWWVWGLAHIYFLIGARSRIAVAVDWLWSYLTGRQSVRLITQVPPVAEAPPGDPGAGVPPDKP